MSNDKKFHGLIYKFVRPGKQLDMTIVVGVAQYRLCYALDNQQAWDQSGSFEQNPSLFWMAKWNTEVTANGKPKRDANEFLPLKALDPDLSSRF